MSDGVTNILWRIFGFGADGKGLGGGEQTWKDGRKTPKHKHRADPIGLRFSLAIYNKIQRKFVKSLREYFPEIWSIV